MISLWNSRLLLVEQGWTGIERTAVESVGSAEFEKLLREDFYDGESFRRLVNEPLALWCRGLADRRLFGIRDERGHRVRMETASTRGYGATMVIELWKGLARESRRDCCSNSVANCPLD